MKTKIRSNFFYLSLFILAAVCFASAGWVSADSPARAVAGKQRVVKRWAFPTEPILLTNLRAKGLGVQSGKPFTADDEWLKGLRFDVENKSSQPVAFLQVHVLLYGVKGYDTPLSIPLKWGEHPMVRSGQVISKPVYTLAPGGKISLTVTEEQYANVRNLVEKGDSMANVGEVRLLTGSVMFADGTVWKGGTLMGPDAARAGVWTEKKDDLAKNSSYLPGDAAYGHASVRVGQTACGPSCRRASGMILISCCSGECFKQHERTTFSPPPGCATPVSITLSCQPCSFQTCLTQEAAPCYDMA